MKRLLKHIRFTKKIDLLNCNSLYKTLIMVMKYLSLPVSVSFDYNSENCTFSNVVCVALVGDARQLSAQILAQYNHGQYIDVLIVAKLAIHLDNNDIHVVSASVSKFMNKDSLQKTNNKIHSNLCAPLDTNTTVSVCHLTFIDKHKYEMEMMKEKVEKYKKCVMHLISESPAAERFLSKVKAVAEEEKKNRPIIVVDDNVTSNHKVTTSLVPCSGIWMKQHTVVQPTAETVTSVSQDVVSVPSTIRSVIDKKKNYKKRKQEETNINIESSGKKVK